MPTWTDSLAHGGPTAAEIGSKQFLINRKGFDQDEVRTFLHRVSLRMSALEQHVARLDVDLAATEADSAADARRIADLVAALERREDDLRAANDRAALLAATREAALARVAVLEAALEQAEVLGSEAALSGR